MKTPLKILTSLVVAAFFTQASIPKNIVTIVPEPVALESLVNYNPSYGKERPFPNQDFSEWTIEEVHNNITRPHQAVAYIVGNFEYVGDVPENPTLEKAIQFGTMDCGGEAVAQARLLLEDGFEPYFLLLGNTDYTHMGLIYKDPITGFWGSSSTLNWANKSPIYETVNDLVQDMKPKQTIFERWGVIRIPEDILLISEPKDLNFEITYDMMPYSINNLDH